ncbi:glycosyltransferase family 2 protein [bacterium]|nr:glycosyltransferase family 2 protein [bacterium]NUP93892.1 glycosyltransferase family 2 protein [Candidatus Omnitrophota bacterium]
MVDISILVPVYNEGETLGETLRQIQEVCQSMHFQTEVIVIDDGSTDSTSQVAVIAGTILLRHERNRGYGASLKTGLREARGEIIVIIDADLTYPPQRIPELVDHLSNADMAVGARTGRHVHIPWLRRPAKWILQKLANRVAGQKIPDLNSGLRAFRKAPALRYMHLFPDGFSLTTTLTLAFLCDGLRVEFLPIDYARRKGKSKINPVRDTINFLVLIIRVAAYFEPLKVFLPATMISGLISLYLLGYYFWKDGGVSDTGVLACTVTLLLFMMGILADLVVRRSRS